MNVNKTDGNEPSDFHMVPTKKRQILCVDQVAHTLQSQPLLS